MRKALLIISLLTSFAILSCKKNDFKTSENLDQGIQQKSAVSSTSILSPNVTLGNEISDGFDPSYRLEVKIFSRYVEGYQNHVEVSIDPTFVLTGGGVRITNTGNTDDGVQAFITASYPKDDGNFNTWVVDTKDHKVKYLHRTYAYAIGMRLYDMTGTPIDAQIVKSHMAILKSVSSYTNHPSTNVAVPLGSVMLSGGAKINNYEEGALLVGSWPNNGWNATAKDHYYITPSTIEAHILTFDNNLPEFGTLTSSYGPVNSVTNRDHSVTASSTNSNAGFLMSGVGGYTTYTGYGRLLYAIYPASETTATVKSKDHLVSDVSGSTWVYPILIGRN